MEEVAMIFSQHVERSAKALHQRRIQLPKPAQALAQVSAAERLAPWHEQLAHLDTSALEQLMLALQQLVERRAPLNQLVHLTDNDPTQTYTILQVMIEQAEVEARKAKAAKLHAYLNRLQRAHSSEITAGLNICAALVAGIDDPNLRQAVRRLYYDKIVLKQSLRELVQQMLGMFSIEYFEHALTVLRRALADDIAAETPSRPTQKLCALLTGLKTAGELSNLMQECKQFLIQCHHSTVPYTPATLTQRLVGLTLSGINAFEAERLCQELNGDQPEAQQRALNILYNLMRQLPLDLWSDPRHRQRSLDAVQAMFVSHPGA
ncbi:hypothetical protein C4K03_4731 [Pseudomonas synxantha]|uniref:Uncharacterized protein n=1 Tax=Pseudomonas synxantha TaxID=47883 RepID=A0A3G7UE25_9PSED|nr:HrpJ domain-containing protein [Pseudomonas synxantha]AZE56869.1 hypothetical protein C4K03_4731 [Pseudomonas synxantha]